MQQIQAEYLPVESWEFPKGYGKYQVPKPRHQPIPPQLAFNYRLERTATEEGVDQRLQKYADSSRELGLYPEAVLVSSTEVSLCRTYTWAFGFEKKRQAAAEGPVRILYSGTQVQELYCTTQEWLTHEEAMQSLDKTIATLESARAFCRRLG